MNRPVDQDKLRRACNLIFEAIGEHPNRPGISGTPDRFARWWEEFINFDPGNLETTFEATKADQLVVVSGIKVWSLCEHHLLPFSAVVSIGYITKDCVLGLSKFARISHYFAHRLQLQERMTEQIADAVQDMVQTPDVIVQIRGHHLCMAMRGVKTPSEMTTSIVRGAFRDEPEARAEALALMKGE